MADITINFNRTFPSTAQPGSIYYTTKLTPPTWVLDSAAQLQGSKTFTPNASAVAYTWTWQNNSVESPKGNPLIMCGIQADYSGDKIQGLFTQRL